MTTFTCEGIMAKRVGIRKLRDGLTRHVGQVRRGERIIVTDRGKPVALLVPYESDLRTERSERLNSLLASGHIEASETHLLSNPPLIKGRGIPASRVISRDRR